ncbi:MAG: Kdo hydroxylase family protein [Candidatus Sumerlaeaceae bacterium]
MKVPHAVMSGRCALEQTFIISKEALVLPELAPIRILEKMSGAQLAY